MNFYVLIGHGGKASLLGVTLDKTAQDDLTEMFKRLADPIVDGEHVAFDPGYRADEGEIVTISPYSLPSVLSVLETATVATDLPAVAEADMLDGAVRGLIGVEWKGDAPRRTLFQRLDSSYVLRRQSRRLMLAAGRFVRDDRPGIEIAERVDAVLEGSTLYIASWPRAHAVLDLSAWVRQATMAETEEFVKHKNFAKADGFEVAAVVDTWVRRKITSISENGLLSKVNPAVLRKYAAKFNINIDVVKGKIVLPADKKQFKGVLSLLDQDLLSFEPTDEHWVVNSKRRP
jgi:hypothetical protein